MCNLMNNYQFELFCSTSEGSYTDSLSECQLVFFTSQEIERFIREFKLSGLNLNEHYCLYFPSHYFNYSVYENWKLKFSSTCYFYIHKPSGLSLMALLQSMFFSLYQQNQVVILKLIYIIFLCTIYWDTSCHPHFTVWHLVKAILLQGFWNQFHKSNDWSIC